MLHAFICECSTLRCKRQVYLEPIEYQKLARMGNVLHIEHMNGQGELRQIREGFVPRLRPVPASPVPRSRPSRANPPPDPPEQAGLREALTASEPEQTQGVNPFA